MQYAYNRYITFPHAQPIEAAAETHRNATTAAAHNQDQTKLPITTANRIFCYILILKYLKTKLVIAVYLFKVKIEYEKQCLRGIHRTMMLLPSPDADDDTRNAKMLLAAF